MNERIKSLFFAVADLQYVKHKWFAKFQEDTLPFPPSRFSLCQLFNHQTVSRCQELEGVEVFGVVEGGDILEERVRSARETAKRPVAGFCLDGLQTGSMDHVLRSQLITAVTKELPEDKPRSLCVNVIIDYSCKVKVFSQKVSLILRKLQPKRAV